MNNIPAGIFVVVLSVLTGLLIIQVFMYYLFMYYRHKRYFFIEKVLGHIYTNPEISGKDLREMYNQGMKGWSIIMQVSECSFYERMSHLENSGYVEGEKEVFYIRYMPQMRYTITTKGNKLRESIIVPPLNLM